MCHISMVVVVVVVVFVVCDVAYTRSDGFVVRYVCVYMCNILRCIVVVALMSRCCRGVVVVCDVAYTRSDGLW